MSRKVVHIMFKESQCAIGFVAECFNVRMPARIVCGLVFYLNMDVEKQCLVWYHS